MVYPILFLHLVFRCSVHSRPLCWRSSPTLWRVPLSSAHTTSYVYQRPWRFDSHVFLCPLSLSRRSLSSSWPRITISCQQTRFLRWWFGRPRQFEIFLLMILKSSTRGHVTSTCTVQNELSNCTSWWRSRTGKEASKASGRAPTFDT